MVGLKETILVLALATVVAHSRADDEIRERQASQQLAAIAEIDPTRIVQASAFFKEAMTTESVASRVTTSNWSEVEILAFRHESGEQRGWYMKDPAVSVEDTLRDYRETMEKLDRKMKYGIPPAGTLRIVGVDFKGEAAKVKKIAEAEGVMVEVSTPGFFQPAPQFTMPPPPPQESQDCTVFDAAGMCASPFRR